MPGRGVTGPRTRAEELKQILKGSRVRNVTTREFINLYVDMGKCSRVRIKFIEVHVTTRYDT